MARKLIHIILISAVLYTASCAGGGDITVAFTGDIIMHIPVKECARQNNTIDPKTGKTSNNSGFDYLFSRVSGVLSDSDMTVANMEFPVSEPFESIPIIFNCHSDVIPAMKKAGIKMVTIANNHILDQGENGIFNTIRNLDENRMKYIGAGKTEESARRGLIQEIKGVRIGFIAYTGYLNYPRLVKKSPYINWFYDKEKVFKDIREIRKKCDFVVMIVHAGTEYSIEPEEKDSSLMKTYIMNGVDLVIAHHPHLIQRADFVKRKDGSTGYIFHSLGNFISNQGSEEKLPGTDRTLSTRDSLIIRLKLTKKGASFVQSFEAVPVTTINNQSGSYREIYTIPIADEITRLKKKASVSRGKEKEIIDKSIKNMYNKTEVLEYSLFRGKKIEAIKFIGVK